jgi:putative ABC transport system permease protein
MRWFGVKNTTKMGLKSLWMHKLRSTLTILGIIFGVCSVIAMLAIGEGASQEAQATLARLGSSNLIIETVKPVDEKVDQSEKEGFTRHGLTYKDAEIIRNTMPDVEVTVPIREITQEARYFNRSASVKIIGTIPWYTEIAPIKLLRGRFLSSTDLEYSMMVCVIDSGVAQKLFTFNDPMNKYIRVFGDYYKVIGITRPVGSTSEISDSPLSESSGEVGTIYIPVTTSKARFTELNYTYSQGSRSAERVELQKITVKVDSIDNILKIRDIVAALLDRLHEKNDYRIIVPIELIREAAHTRRVFSIVLGSIAAISLLVGGIGIMNIMLATVSERTREIGIRRALGAKKRDIIIQFLSETLILTILGGVIGISVGMFIPYMVTLFAKMPTVITMFSLILAFGISGATGIIFGLYPAYRAANMNPIESLRHE